MSKCQNCNGMGREVYTTEQNTLSTMTCQECDGVGRK